MLFVDLVQNIDYLLVCQSRVTFQKYSILAFSVSIRAFFFLSGLSLFGNQFAHLIPLLSGLYQRYIGYLPNDSLIAFPFKLVFIFPSFEPVGAVSKYGRFRRKGDRAVFRFCAFDLFGSP